MFDQHLLNKKCSNQFVKEIADIALDATQIPYQYSQIKSTRGLSIQCWNQHSKYFSSSTFKWSQNQMTCTFSLEIFPHTHYGVRDVASLLLIIVQLKKLYSMHPLQCYITGTWLNPMTSTFIENRCWCHLFLPLMKNYLWSSKSIQEGLNWMEVSKFCQKPTKYGQVMFCEAVKVDMANSKNLII